MMKTLTTAMTLAMMTSISEVMETMFYLPVEFGEEPAALIQSGMDKNRPNMACQLKFNGDVSGSFILLIPKELLYEMTENFMGESKGNLEEEHLTGTLTETLNMICGNALSRIDSKKPFELDIPRVIDESKLPENQMVTIVNTPESMMAINISMD